MLCLPNFYKMVSNVVSREYVRTLKGTYALEYLIYVSYQNTAPYIKLTKITCKGLFVCLRKILSCETVDPVGLYPMASSSCSIELELEVGLEVNEQPLIMGNNWVLDV